MAAGKYNITCDQGASYIQNFYYKDANDNALNLSGYTARMVISEEFGGTVLDTHTTSDNISIVSFLGLITVNIPDATTSTYTAGQYVYDLEIESSLGTVDKLIRGNFIVRAEA